MAQGRPVSVNSQAELNALFKSTTYVVVDFYADWCGPCKNIAPHLEQLASMYDLPGHFAIAKVNVDHARDVAAQYRISAMPTFMFFKGGQQVAVNGNPLVRGADLVTLKEAVDKLGALAKKKAQAATS